MEAYREKNARKGFPEDGNSGTKNVTENIPHSEFNI